MLPIYQAASATELLHESTVAFLTLGGLVLFGAGVGWLAAVRADREETEDPDDSGDTCDTA